MKKVVFCIETGFAGCDIKEVREVPDDTPCYVLDEMAYDFLFNHINYGWYDEDEED